MDVIFHCADCHTPLRVELACEPKQIACRQCGRVAELRSDGIVDGRLRYCLLCATPDMYVQKAFPHRLGLAIVAIGFLLSTVAWWQYRYPTALGILLATAALDSCLYYWVGDVTVCYRCLARYRGVQRDPAHRAFDLGIGERYRQERLRLDQLRRDRDRTGNSRAL